MFDFDDLEERAPAKEQSFFDFDALEETLEEEGPADQAVADNGPRSPAHGLDSGAEQSRRQAERQLFEAAAASDPLAVLGLDVGATGTDIRRAYHRLALLHHPDKAGDPVVFRVVLDAYRSLTEARRREMHCPDLDGQAVGPWQAHSEKVTVVSFDHFGAPPWEKRRLYTGGWSDGTVRCWELSQGDGGDGDATSLLPRFLGEIEVGGFLNDAVALSPCGLLTAQSAGLKPQPGESLRAWDLNRTPLRHKKHRLTRRASDGEAVPESDHPTQDEQYLQHSQMVHLHHRGVRCISLWPRPESLGAAPILVGTVSKDCIGLSRITDDGCGLEQPALWKREVPHGLEGDVNTLRHESISKVWSGGNDGVVRCWDVERASASGCALQIAVSQGAWISGIEIWPEQGVLVATSSNGIAYLDTRAGKVIRKQHTQNPASRVSVPALGQAMLFVGIGNDLLQYDTRCFVGGAESKPKAVGSWTLPDAVMSVSCCTTRKGSILVAAGCRDGRVAAFDSA